MGGQALITDVHTHLGRRSNASARVDCLLRSMDTARIDTALVFAGSVSGARTNDMLDEIDAHLDRLSGVAAVELSAIAGDIAFGRSVTVDALSATLRDQRVVAAKFYLGYEHFDASSNVVRTAMHAVDAAKKTAIFHSGHCHHSAKDARLKYAHPLSIDDVATVFPDARIVIAHMGHPWQLDAAAVCHKNANVFVDVSGFVYGSFDGTTTRRFRAALEEFSELPDRILFGSDWPVSDQSSYVDVCNNVFDWGVIGQNTSRAYTL